ncbi:MAG: 3-deoxy-manno-octulosonate-8-phosphatase KdsC [Gammaproteobacteria bacterium]|nr:3-deoxy-manno-octulosonate-8-phosphatase KdsC [Gammaproteobacteria bacterium]NIM72209.1 3-deoxy-manno-octulosonate-8-phosphatase KdsC [Gammaproteobacteria bacterium]NIN39124.1 3-deoxy-manno-octulosonate-8-phosphatase KdsC [Gammaproteobacteria bacterium]NIO23957.1 3-deoxy-manno-octulosonate-8-phosphatase KdsC [Gammaproteobacteria bacterium]NIO64609.1 3-deoxy-manno-octulosonate-8-phosphatase KdsC [Gammaproteobacteria bacterium]
MFDASPEVLVRAAKIKLLLFDVDGVLTDGRLLLGDNGVEYKAFHSRDGHGMKMLASTGVELAIITGRRSQLVSERMASLGITHVYQGHASKLPVFEKLVRDLELSESDTAYVGDDVVDLGIMARAGLAVAVANAHPLVLERAHWHTRAEGGGGAAREVCDLIMHAQGTLENIHREYLMGNV